jgi:hypothetical protein
MFEQSAGSRSAALATLDGEHPTKAEAARAKLTTMRCFIEFPSKRLPIALRAAKMTEQLPQPPQLLHQIRAFPGEAAFVVGLAAEMAVGG